MNILIRLNKMALCEVLFLFLQLSVYVLITQRSKFFNKFTSAVFTPVLALRRSSPTPTALQTCIVKCFLASLASFFPDCKSPTTMLSISTYWAPLSHHAIVIFSI